MRLIRWQPFEEMLRMQESINQIFRKHFDDMNQPSDGQTACWTPPADIFESEKAFHLRLELPGMKKEDVKIEFNDNQITISGERKRDSEHKPENHHRMECLSGQFNRSFSLPHHIDPEKIEGSLKDGVLSISIPKSEKALKKSIPIVSS